MKALVVDDEKLIVKGLKFSLEQEGYEVEERRPGDRPMRLQNAGRNHGRNRIRGIVHSVQEIERKRDQDQTDQERKSQRDHVHVM